MESEAVHGEAVGCIAWLDVMRFLPVIQKLSDIVSFFCSIWPDDNPIHHFGFGKLYGFALSIIGNEHRGIRDDTVDEAVLDGVNVDKDIFSASSLPLAAGLIQACPDEELIIRWQPREIPLLGRRVRSAGLSDVRRNRLVVCLMAHRTGGVSALVLRRGEA